MNKPRAYTTQEVEDKVMYHLAGIAEYWSTVKRQSTLGICQGVLHSTLAAIGGRTLDFPAFDLVPALHAEDKQYLIDNGENYYSKKTRVQLDHILLVDELDLGYPTGRKKLQNVDGSTHFTRWHCKWSEKLELEFV